MKSEGQTILRARLLKSERAPGPLDRMVPRSVLAQ